MKHISRAVIAVILAMLVMTVMPAQVFADSLPEYIGEVKVYIGDYKDAEKEGFKILNGDDGNPVDLNKGAGGGLGSKGDKAVYLGYKTTTVKSEAITDLALMNMKGGYSVQDYEALMDAQMKSQIIPLTEKLLTAVREYRENYAADNQNNRQRADYIHDALNKLTDDDCGGAGLGDLLLNETKYEMGDEAYNALSDEQKNEHVDLVTLFAQANGQATLLLEDLITRGSDPSDSNWIDRFSEITYDNLVDSTGMAPTDAEIELAKLYDDDANIILDMWDAFRDQLLKADENEPEIDIDALEKNNETMNGFDFETATDSEIQKFGEASAENDVNTEAYTNGVADLACKEYLSSIGYEDGSMYDFFTRESDEIADDITVLYPLVAALSAGQRAGLEFVTLSTLVTIAGTSDENYADAEIDKLESVSVYKGVDRAIYEKGGVALTSEALRKNAEELAGQNGDLGLSLSWYTMLSGALTVVSVGAFAYGLKQAISVSNQIKNLRSTLYNITDEMNAFTRIEMQASKMLFDKQINMKQANELFSKLSDARTATKEAMEAHNEIVEGQIGRVSAKSATCSKLAVGLGVAMVILAAVTTYLTWRDMQAHYKVDFTPVPKYIIDEKDLVSYNKKGEKIVLKNQSAYYKAVESNLEDGDFKFDEIGAVADMNGCVGKQWLVLYSNSNELMNPILASSLKAVIGSSEIPSGYSKGIHMFGSDAAFNLNSNLYDWNESAKSVFVYYKTDDFAASTTGTTFSGGTLALTGGAGLAIGALATAFATKSSRKKRDSEPANT